MDYPNWQKAVFQPVIGDRMFWMDYLIVLVKKLYRMMTFDDDVSKCSRGNNSKCSHGNKTDCDSGGIFD